MNYYVDDYKKQFSYETDTAAINQAIKDCSENGGGKVIFSQDTLYRAGLVNILSNVELHFEEGSKLMASDNLVDFAINGTISDDKKISQPTWENCDYSGAPNKFFLYAKEVENISLSGEGTIDGNEEIFYGNVTKWHIDGYFYPRVPLIFFEGCKKVSITNVTLQRSAFWTTHLVGCENVLVENVKILNNLRLANCDGIDPDHCKNVKIKNCHIEAADDCIVFKTTENAFKYGACENIEVSGCTLMSTSAAIKFGTESVCDFKNIYIHDCKIVKSNRGIAFQLRDEGNISNIKFENIDIETRRFAPIYWWGKAEPIVITAVQRRLDSKVGTISNVIFENINADSENGIFIFGEDVQNIKDIRFNNVNINVKAKTDWEKNTYDLRPCEKYQIINSPMSVVKINNAKDITFVNFNYQIDDSISKDIKENFEFTNSKDILI